ncbi:hypothetical protein H0H81_001113 [Sphagnurus paluster]|uniref:Uncharacterized protein n=1 Tax=Sphagnurus paluster TaxID=117069 RepID=A0A9P7FW80_9AGAR|nr:hypothetical protein H0H81_001113 [Sphagnurus paluster]
MRSSIFFASIVVLSIALSSTAAPPYIKSDGSLSSRLRELEARTGPDVWSTIPQSNKFPNEAKGKLNAIHDPLSGKAEKHITYRKSGDRDRDPPVHITHYQVWKPNPYKPGSWAAGGRWRGNDGVGKDHGGIPPPIWYPAAGEEQKKDAYQATSYHHPPSYDQAKFSKSIKDKVAKMPKQGRPQGKSKDDLAHKTNKISSVEVGKSGAKTLL